ncbi:MAG: formate hydrogenlyase, partial [Betaproteobacteria bacterium]|nr:formate hydrogenlyase [Betaproteobacteria bacterium]
MTTSLSQQLVNLLAAALLLIAFAMLSQRRVLSLIRLFAWQGMALGAST